MKILSLENATYAIRLDRGERFIESLLAFSRQNQVGFARFEAIGAALSAEIGFYHLERKEYEYTKIEVPLEIASLTGTITLAGGIPFVHAHGVLSDATLTPYGGHINEIEIGATCEVILRVFDRAIHRAPDESTGLRLWNLDDSQV